MIEEQDAIGSRLRSARVAAGLSLDDVVFQTQLPRKVLDALENEDFSVFSSPLYAKSFLSQYSGFLGVDADPWIDAIEPCQFVPTRGIATILKGPAESVPAAPAPVGRRGGRLAMFGLLVVSVGIAAAAFKGYHAFDKRFGGEPPAASHLHSDSPPEPAPLPEVLTPVSDPIIQASQNTETAAGPSEEDLLNQAPPRAIIVR